MSRPRKNNADYFSHDNDMRNDEKIKAVRHKFGLTGYAIWCMLLEKLCKADNFELSLTEMNLELWSGDFEVEKDLLSKIIDYFIEIDLLQRNGTIIASSELITRFEGLFRKRKRDRIRVIADGNTQSKVKYSKVKKNKETYSPNSVEFSLSNKLLFLIRKRNDKYKQPDMQKWAKHIDLLIRKDKRAAAEIGQVIDWCQADSFWQNNILSTEKLRKQYDQLRLKMPKIKQDRDIIKGRL